MFGGGNPTKYLIDFQRFYHYLSDLSLNFQDAFTIGAYVS